MSVENKKPWPVWIVFGEGAECRTEPKFREFATKAEVDAYLIGIEDAAGSCDWAHFYTKSEALEYIREELEQESEVEA